MMDVRGILKRKFDHNGKLVHRLAQEVADLQQSLRNRRAAAVVVIYPDGDVKLYADHKLDAKIVHMPYMGENPSVDLECLTEECLKLFDLKGDERYTSIAFVNRREIDHGNAKRCGTISQYYNRRKAALDAYDKAIENVDQIFGKEARIQRQARLGVRPRTHHAPSPPRVLAETATKD